MNKEIEAAYAYIKTITDRRPKSAIILGTGLGALVDDVAIDVSIPYGDIPHFPVSTVESHHGRLIFGTLDGVDVLVMQGRFHYYEGYSMKEITLPVRVMKLLGVTKLFISNAAGGLNPEQEVSDLMIINDHINLFPEHPLRGSNDAAWGPRFPDMSEPYYQPWIDRAMEIGKQLEIGVHQGVYAAVTGPTLETKAEYKYISIIGADAVGMSTIPENIVAVHMGMRVFAVSVITDLGIAGKIEKVTVEKVIAAAHKAEPGLTVLIRTLIKEIN